MILPPDEAQLFFELLWKLQFYVNQKQDPSLAIPSLDAYLAMPAETKLKTRDLLWEQPQLIDEYLQHNPDALPDEKLEIIRRWKAFIKGSFYIFRHLKKGSIFIGDPGDRVYSVQGLTEPLEEIIPPEVLPQMVNAVLLPFKGRITYDGLLTGFNIYFGGGIRSSLNHTYSTAKRKGSIITSLDASPVPPAPRKPRRNIAPQLDELIAGLEKLKGDSRLQKSALALARLGLDVAASDARGPLYPDDLEVHLRKLHRTATRLLNILYEQQQDTEI